jgi:hypothetical protein
LSAKIANDAITIAQTTSEASRSKRTIEDTTPLHYVPAWMPWADIRARWPPRVGSWWTSCASTRW